MAVPSMMAFAGRVARWQGRKSRSRLVGASVVAGIWFGVACGAAESVNIPTATCTPQLCFAPDIPPGPPGGSELCPPGECNYQTQVGCPAGATCAVHIDNAAAEATPKCVAAGLRKAGEPCDNSSTDPANFCGRGMQCIGDPGEQGVCRKLCCGGAPYGDWRACDPGESCIRQIQPRIERPPGSGMFVNLDAHVSFCVPVNTCDVLDAKSCANDKIRPVCRIVDPLARVACRPPADSQVGAKCDKEDQCGPVQHCAQRIDFQGVPQTDKQCRRLCRVTPECGNSTCPQDQGVCVHFKRDPEGVGECTPNFNEDLFCHDLEGGVQPVPMQTPTDAGTG